MDNDDLPVGRVLDRREVFSLLGKASLGTLFGIGALRQAAKAADTTCVVRPALTEGPYFKDEKLNRSDIRTDPSDNSVRPGVPLDLSFRVSRVGTDGCSPLVGATVDIWHCDALGSYSDYQQEGTAGKKFLRGYQLTDSDGLVRFTTIYPGWYQGRAVHIHFKIRTSAGSYVTSEFTSQLFFDDTLTDKVHAANAPYSTKGLNRLKNTGDNIFTSGGSQLILALTEVNGGYSSTFDVGVNVACADLAKGDANGDGKVDTGDAVYALRSSVGLESPNDCNLSAADVSGDGKVNVSDALSILRHVVDGTSL